MWGTGDFGTSPIFMQLLEQAAACQFSLSGVSERKAQWRIEKLQVSNFIQTQLSGPYGPSLMASVVPFCGRDAFGQSERIDVGPSLTEATSGSSSMKPIIASL